MLGDLTVVGSLQGGGGLGDVDLVYVPEPSALTVLAMGMVFIGVCRRGEGRTPRKYVLDPILMKNAGSQELAVVRSFLTSLETESFVEWAIRDLPRECGDAKTLIPHFGNMIMKSRHASR